MIEIRFAQESDRALWMSIDGHLPEGEFANKVRSRQAYLLLEDGAPAALMRYNLFWDSVPFCTLLYVLEGYRGRGFGRMLMERWAADMKALGHGMLMTSTQTDETAKHFYRKLGYRDAGGLVIVFPRYAQPMELFLIRQI